MWYWVVVEALAVYVEDSSIPKYFHLFSRTRRGFILTDLVYVVGDSSVTSF
jgi:hypothetical protein